MLKPLPQGIWAAALTPISTDLQCHFLTLVSHCLDLIERGCQGVVLFGTSGEGPSFSVTERLDALENLIAAGVPPEKIILGNGSSNLTDTIILAHAAQMHGCAASLIAPPSFYKGVSEEGILSFYRGVIKGVDSPHFQFLLYHIPQYTGVPITARIISALLHEFPDHVLGLKESEGNRALIREVLAVFSDFQVFVGSERLIIEAVQEGAAGSICGIANLYPEFLTKLYEDAKEGLRVMGPAMDTLYDLLKKYPFIAAAKAIMQEKHGPTWHNLRPPLVPLNAAERQDLLTHLQNFTSLVSKLHTA